MVKYITLRFFEKFIILFLITLMMFLALAYPWGGVESWGLLIPDTAEGREKIQSLNELFGYNDFFLIQYGRWIRNIFTGDSIMGASYYSQ